ncbi:MAG: hypothetical protein V4638_00505 [Bacteroidota bacterium]
MKRILSILFISLFWSVQGQIHVGMTYNVDVYRPFTEEAQTYLEINDRVRSQTVELIGKSQIWQKSKFSLDLGFSYKFINLRVIDKVTSVDGPINGPYSNHYDLISKSHSLGLLLGFRRSVFHKEKKIGEIGLVSNVYIFEIFKAKYKLQQYDDFSYSSQADEPNYPYYYPYTFFPSANLSIGYKQFLIQKEKFNLGAKVSVGTNLYSDWDLFRKYVWLGVGLEMGFGQGKALFKEKKTTATLPSL